MPTREEIREGVGNLSQMDNKDCSYELCRDFKDNCRKCRSTYFMPKDAEHKRSVLPQRILEAGFEATVPLIEEGK